jgi:hypothetical protein
MTLKRRDIKNAGTMTVEATVYKRIRFYISFVLFSFSSKEEKTGSI